MYFRTHFPHTNEKLPGLSGFHDGRGVPGRTTLFIFYDKYPFYDLVFPYLCTES